jgi:multiple sugar transport system ATP-binding protein
MDMAEATDMASVELRNIGKNYGRVQAVDDVSLSIQHRELVVFVGPSGCGKSTLLRMIAGLETISSGELFIGGKPMNAIAAADRGIAMVFQSYALYPHMTVAENMGFALKMIGMPRAEVERRVRDAATILQLDALLDRKPRQLSGGQRQRVAIGRAITRNPDVFLFDEPLSNLDADLRSQMRVEIARLHAELGTTMIYVTHDQIEAMTLADRIVILNNGRVEQQGAPMELYERPVNRFVAGFLGQPKMNFLPASVLAGRHPLPSGAVEVGLRPHAIHLVSEGGIGASVVLIERLGGSSLVHVRVDGAPGLITLETSANPAFLPGDQVQMHVDDEAIYAFDEGGRVLS